MIDLYFHPKLEQDDDGLLYTCWLLLDRLSSRILGYVDEPTPRTRQVQFVACLYDGGMRRYTSLGDAQAWLEHEALKAHVSESKEDIGRLNKMHKLSPPYQRK